MSTVFISDLHLCNQRPRVTEAFVQFLKSLDSDIEALYILGDFFEYWIGDEAMDDEQYIPVVSALREATGHGLKIYLMHGNRDFLIGEHFARQTGCTLLPDPTVINLGDSRVILAHGDALCTDDIDHMKFRKMVRAEVWQREFLSKPVEERIEIAQHYREISQESTAAKPEEIMDVNQGEVERLMTDNRSNLLIHGHTHRPNVHHFQLGHQPACRYVLGDWYDQGSLLICNESSCKLETLDY